LSFWHIRSFGRAAGFRACLVGLTLSLCFDPAQAQSVTIIENAHILVGDGTAIAGGTVVIGGDKISDVGTDVRPSKNPFSGPARIDAQGKFVTPGLIDSWSTIAARMGAGEGRAYSLAADAFDVYAEHALNDALRQGVTAVYLPARAGSGIGGIGAVVRLIPGGSREAILLSERAALSTVFADAKPLVRVGQAEAVRKAFREAREYREALETYEEDLKQYEKDLAEWVKKQEEVTKDSDGEAKPGSQPASKDSKPAEKPRRRGKRGPKPDSDKLEQQPGDADKSDEVKSDKKGKKGDKDGKDEDGAPEKPTKPPRSPDKDVLLEVIDGELIWRVEAYRPADLLNAIEIADEFNLALVFEGATGSHELADELAEREVAVVVDASAPSVRYTGGIQRDRASSQIEALTAAGVDVLIASGPGGAESSPNLAARAALAISMGMKAGDALSAMTSSAAETLGVGDRIGRIEAGMGADLVIWSDHPFAPGARVERVFIAGREVFSATEADAVDEDQ
jgi:imidazolonepropionase-like amidohydrolase